MKTKNYKENILKLRAEGKTYKEISELLQCNLSTVQYYLDPNRKDYVKKKNARQPKQKKSVLSKKIDNFKRRGVSRAWKNQSYIVDPSINFSEQDVINRFGPNFKCYITGESININDPKDYCLDHKIPTSRGGNNSLDNLGICKTAINKMKSDLLLEEFFEVCETILAHRYTLN